MAYSEREFCRLIGEYHQDIVTFDELANDKKYNLFYENLCENLRIFWDYRINPIVVPIKKTIKKTIKKRLLRL